MSRPLFPPDYVPLGLNRAKAAHHIGVGTTLFDQMVSDGRMPPPKRVNRRRLWDRVGIEMAFHELPEDANGKDDNEWDRI